jgi:hypothetical protein
MFAFNTIAPETIDHAAILEKNSSGLQGRNKYPVLHQTILSHHFTAPEARGEKPRTEGTVYTG